MKHCVTDLLLCDGRCLLLWFFFYGRGFFVLGWVACKYFQAVIDYFAVWCGPCRMIAPKVEALSESLAKSGKDAKFYQVDVDEVPAVAQKAEIQAMPTFHGYKKGGKVFELVGANPAKLESLILANL